MFVDVRIADKVRGQGAGSVLTAAQIETIVRTALQAFRLLHIIPQSISSSRSCLSPCPVCVSAALPGIEHRARRRDKERERGPGYRCDGIGIL